MTRPNQRKINIVKRKEDGIYYQINQKILFDAIKSFNSIGEYALYLYLSKNQDGYSFELSSKDFINETGMTRQSFTKAWKKLGEKGYLEKIAGNIFNFHVKPKLEYAENFCMDGPQAGWELEEYIKTRYKNSNELNNYYNIKEKYENKELTKDDIINNDYICEILEKINPRMLEFFRGDK